jgi:cobalamin biosynthesis protein CobD/CbiB
MAARRYPHPVPREGLGESISGLAEDTGRLVRLEIELLKQEIFALLKRNAIAVGLLAASGLAAFVLLIIVQVLLVVALPWHAWVALALTLLWLALAVILAVVGRRRLQLKAPEATIQTLKEDLEWARTLIKPAPR